MIKFLGTRQISDDLGLLIAKEGGMKTGARRRDWITFFDNSKGQQISIKNLKVYTKGEQGKGPALKAKSIF